MRSRVLIRKVWAKSSSYADDAGLWFAFELALPDPNNSPARTPEAAKVSNVPRPVAGDFLLPEAGDVVFPRRKSVAMPKLTVDENGDLRLSEHNIRFAW